MDIWEVGSVGRSLVVEGGYWVGVGPNGGFWELIAVAGVVNGERRGGLSRRASGIRRIAVNSITYRDIGESNDDDMR